MQWRWIEDKKEIEGVSTAECLGTWSNIAGIEKKSKERCRRYQKIRKTSKPSASLPQ